jgi:hypothetical protein
MILLAGKITHLYILWNAGELQKPALVSIASDRFFPPAKHLTALFGESTHIKGILSDSIRSTLQGREWNFLRSLGVDVSVVATSATSTTNQGGFL